MLFFARNISLAVETMYHNIYVSVTKLTIENTTKKFQTSNFIIIKTSFKIMPSFVIYILLYSSFFIMLVTVHLVCS